MNQKMHKAISIIQFKAEGQIIKRHPEFGLEKRNLLHHIDFERGVLEMDGKEYKMLDMHLHRKKRISWNVWNVRS